MAHNIQMILRAKLPLAGFFAMIATGLASRWANGYVYSSVEAKQLLDALSSSALYLGSAIATSSATTLALMLTLVGLVKRLDKEFDTDLYQRVALVSRLSAINLIGAVVLLMLLAMPVGEFDNLPASWFATLYNILYGMMVFLCALIVAIVLLLAITIETLIAKITPSEDV